MRTEIDDIPAACVRLLDDCAAAIREAAGTIAALDPAFYVTVARGSSDHACTYFKYVTELLTGVPVASVGPSVASIYHAKLRLRGGVVLAVSQSGQSPDIVALTSAARAGGGHTVAITNRIDSPLAGAAHAAIDIHAGPELSVAATKTFVTSALATLMLAAEIARDDALLDSLATLPDHLAQAARADWNPAADAVLSSGSLYCIGRGPAWAIANEAALKFKETALIHAESYSSAEVMHGPVSIVERGFPVLAFAAGDAAESALVDVADRLAEKGATVFATSPRAGAAQALPVIRTGHPLTDPLALIVSFYGMVESVAVAKGIDPDHPRHLSKVTETL
jgi:glucosamine--fructose-6-phosphate aminotransferase (isomerizing)